MSITDELREWAEDNTLKDRVLTTYPPQHAVHGVLETLLRIADRIDAEHQKAIRELNNLADSSVLLPVDADGEYIHMGDRMENGELVVRIVLTDGSWEPTGYTASTPNQLHEHYCHDIRHRHAPTVEDVLRECVAAYMDTPLDELNEGEFFAEYAAKLRLAGDAE